MAVHTVHFTTNTLTSVISSGPARVHRQVTKLILYLTYNNYNLDLKFKLFL